MTSKPTSFFYGEKILIKGLNLMSSVTYLRIDNNDYQLSNESEDMSISKTEISFKLSGEKLRSGLQTIQVVHPLMMGNPKVEHKGYTSKALSIKLHPIIVSQSIAGEIINVEILPAIQKGQKCYLVLTEIMDIASTTSGKEYVIDFTDGVESESLGNMYFIDKPLNLLREGKKYLVRVKIDNLMSFIADDYKTPMLEI